MEVSHELIRTGRQATQRDIYYKVYEVNEDARKVISDWKL